MRRSYLKLDKYSSIIRENNHFRQQLLNYFSGSDIDRSKFEKLRYKQDDLTAFFDLYNGTKPEETAKSSVSLMQGFNFKLLAGGQLAQFKAGSYNQPLLIDMKNRIIFSGGLEIENILPFNQRKWSLFVGVTYQKYKQQGQTEYGVGVMAQHETLELPFGLRHYFFVGAKQKIALEVGYLVAVTLSGELQYGTGNIYNANYDFSNSGTLFLGSGYTYDRYSLQLRYAFPRNILTSYVNWDGSYGAFTAMFAVKIF